MEEGPVKRARRDDPPLAETGADEDMVVEGDATPRARYTGPLPETDDEMIGQLEVSGLTISEVYSPPRVSHEALKMGLKRDFALDIAADDPTTGRRWDLGVASVRREVIRRIEDEKPDLLVVTPPCTWLSVLMRWNFRRMDPAKVTAG